MSEKFILVRDSPTMADIWINSSAIESVEIKKTWDQESLVATIYLVSGRSFAMGETEWIKSAEFRQLLDVMGATEQVGRLQKENEAVRARREARERERLERKKAAG